MSTKSTIAYGKNFHFYHEALDDDHVYLELETTQFEAGYGRVMIPIPIHIWETIRHLGGARFDLVHKTDEELQVMVEQEVDKRIAKYQEALRERPKSAGWISLAGSLVYGSANDPREQQLESALAYYIRERRHQQEVQAAVLELRKEQSRP